MTVKDEHDNNVDLEIIIVEDDNTIFVQFTGFEDIEQVEDYAAFLHEHLPLMLFQTKVQH